MIARRVAIAAKSQKIKFYVFEPYLIPLMNLENMILENGYHVALILTLEYSLTFDNEEMIVINAILPDSQLNFFRD